MCLHEVISLKTRKPEFKISKDRYGFYGWKVYRKIDKDYCLPRFKGFIQRVEEWIKSSKCSNWKDRKIDDCTGHKYPVGFHVYLRRTIERGYFAKKVYIKKVVAKGYQNSNRKGPTIICKEIFIPKKKGKKP